MESTLLNSSADLEHSNAEASSRVVEKLLQLAKWSDIYPYLLENGYIPASQGTEKQAKRALVDLDTYVVALLLCHKFFEGGEPFTLRSLSMAMDGEDFNSIKAMEKRLLRSGFSHEKENHQCNITHINGECYYLNNLCCEQYGLSGIVFEEEY